MATEGGRPRRTYAAVRMRKIRFAKSLAEGVSAVEAARQAGYRTGSGRYVTASRLTRDPEVCRILEAARAEAERQIIEAARAEVNES